MRETIINFPKQFKKGFEAAEDIKIKGKFNKVLVCGMGGSAWPANILLACLPNLKTPLFIHRNYGLPEQADKKTLLIIASYSGNTEEPVSAFEEAVKRGLKIAVITKGGKLKDLAEKNKIPLVLLPDENIQPRSASGYLVSAMLKILSNSKIIKDKTEEVLETADNLKPLIFEEEAKQLALKLKNKIPIIYSSDNLKALARIWKIKFNENSKTMAFWNYFPELNHNEMSGLEKLNGNFHILILRDKNIHQRILKRMSLFSELAKEKGIPNDFLEISGKNIFEKIFSNLILSDWISYYLAKEYGFDPESIKLVEEFKKSLEE